MATGGKLAVKYLCTTTVGQRRSSTKHPHGANWGLQINCRNGQVDEVKEKTSGGRPADFVIARVPGDRLGLGFAGERPTSHAANGEAPTARIVGPSQRAYASDRGARTTRVKRIKLHQITR